MSTGNPKFNYQDSIAASKQQWRLHLKNIRQNLSPERQDKGSVDACQALRAACQKAHFVLSFASFGSEINLWPINQELCAEGRLVLPLVREKRELLLFLITHFNQLEPHPFGMLQPKPSACAQIDPFFVEIALIPGLGFDQKNKHRLGYGLGCYDTLFRSNSRTQKWGIGFLEQEVVNLPFIESDMALDKIFLF